MSSLRLHSPTLKVKLDYLKKNKQLFKTTHIKTAHTQYEKTQSATAPKALHCTHKRKNKWNIWSVELSETFPFHMHVLQKLSRCSHYRARYACRTRSQGRETEGKSRIPMMRRGWLGGGTSLSLGKTAKHSCEKKPPDRKQVFCSTEVVDKTGRAD